MKTLLKEAYTYRRGIVLLKLGRRWRWVRPMLAKMDLLDQTIFAKRVGWPDEEVLPALKVDESEQSYFSLLFIRQHVPDRVL